MDLIIIGGGPAGLTAGLYAARAGLKVMLFEKMMIGGQAATTDLIENYPGFTEGINGIQLTMQMQQQAERFGLLVEYQQAKSITKSEDQFIVHTDENEYTTSKIILATGAHPRELGLPSEMKLRGRGVSYCATCDGALYKDKIVAVVGGGNGACETALYLSKFVKQVYLIHRRDEFRATKILQDRVFSTSNINIIWNSVVSDMIGDSQIQGIILKNTQTNQTQELTVDGIFISIGQQPSSDIVKGIVDLDENGYIITDQEMKTSQDGIYAIGDVRSKILRQVVTAINDGAIASESIVKEFLGI